MSSPSAFPLGAAVFGVTIPRIYDVSPTYLLNVPKRTRYNGTDASCYKDYAVQSTEPTDRNHPPRRAFVIL
jgi:hypothetical protein